eukprot:1157419-Pelagomonas_calceolata.AAC.1
MPREHWLIEENESARGKQPQFQVPVPPISHRAVGSTRTLAPHKKINKSAKRKQEVTVPSISHRAVDVTRTLADHNPVARLHQTFDVPYTPSRQRGQKLLRGSCTTV